MTKELKEEGNNTNNESDSMINQLKKFIEENTSFEQIEWAINSADHLDCEKAIKFLLEVALSNKYPRYKQLALEKMFSLLIYEDLRKEYLKELVTPIKDVLIEHDDEWVSLRALQIYDKLTTDAKLVSSKAIDLLKRTLICNNVKEESFKLLDGRRIPKKSIKKDFITIKDANSKFWLAYLLYTRSEIEYRDYLLEMIKQETLNDLPIEFWNKHAIKYALPPTELPQQDSEMKPEKQPLEIGIDYKDEFKIQYKNRLDEIWKKFPYEKSIFIMMPFRFEADSRYEQIRDAIKQAAEENGFSAYLSNDDGRKFTDVLWENLLLNMLSCKYGIAILPSEEIVDINKEKIWIINNPNVALEFGFMYARGRKNVLILTNEREKLPADIRGLIVDEFNLNKPSQKIYKLVLKWLEKKI